MSDVGQLLRAYAAEKSEDAFRELVERHIALVYSTALRIVRGETALAEDVAQTVFCDLARKAASLPANVVLSGWLYRHTTFTASKALRSDARRRLRERQATTMNRHGEDEDVWQQLTPLLDEAISSLSAADRDAVVMRFFEKRDLRWVGEVLRVGEDAAQKRVSRALEKLRAYFESRGVTVSSAALAAVISGNAVGAVPASLAGAVTAKALVGAGAAAPILFSLIMGKAKSIAFGAVIVAAVTTPLVMQYGSVARLRAENADLRQQLAVAPPTEPLVPAAAAPDNRELLRLRAEVARLRRESVGTQQARPESKPAPPPNTPPVERVASELWTDRGFASPMDTLQTAHWAIRNANRDKFRESIFITDEARAKLHDVVLKMAAKAPPAEAAKALEMIEREGLDAEEGLFFPMVAQDRKHGYKAYRVLTETIQPHEHQITVELEMNTASPQTRKFRFKQFGDGWKQVIDVADLPAEVR